MNSADICHQVSDCPDLFVDAFRGHFLRDHTKNPDATFILSHYHGDHYQQLQRDNKYRGPAKIHCTPITARLLIEVHQIPETFVVEHNYGLTFRHRIVHRQQKKGRTKIEGSDSYANITFYDANHCPGACIILIELPDGKTAHLHTGDMRYHPRFQSYHLLSKFTKERKLDLVYLDTTYCHPKHDFLTQEEAVDSIASQTQQLLSDKLQQDSSQKSLVLLSCYSIGKEKVLYEASKRSNQLIYVSEKKWKMLRCIQDNRLTCKKNSSENQQKMKEEDTCASTYQQHTNILERCTRDSSASNLHVIPMGLAGEMWPYFQPNFQKIAKYVEDLSSLEQLNSENRNQESKREGRISSLNERKLSRNEYDRVVAFIPTGWADASNWNKKNAISIKKVELPSSDRSLHVEVRLISYSEHSTFPELVSFVQYLKPRKIIPTVYSDQVHKRQIEGRFRNMLDSNRAKEVFFRSMTKNKNTIPPTTSIDIEEDPMPFVINQNDSAKEGTFSQPVQLIDSDDAKLRTEQNESTARCAPIKDEEELDEVSVVRVVRAKESRVLSGATYSPNKNQNIDNDKISMIVSMGFDRQRAEVVLEKFKGNMQETIDEILSENIQKGTDSNHVTLKKQITGTKTWSPQVALVKKRKISDFFVQKKK